MKIGIVNDLPMAVEALRRMIALAPEHHVVWIAHTGVEAVEQCAREKPDLVLMDLIMPEMGGVEATRQIMAATPCAILLVTVSVEANSPKVFEAMGYGALDAIDTPSLGAGDIVAAAAPLLTKISTIRKLLGNRERPDTPAKHPSLTVRQGLVALGASAGGPAALATVLSALPSDFSAAVVVVQHIDQQFVSHMGRWLDQQSSLPVRLAEQGESPTAGVVLLANTTGHLVFSGADRLGYTQDPRNSIYRPSIDVFFQSVSKYWPGKAVGTLLTGMGRDGALGLLAMRRKGCHTIAQDQATSAVYGMPKAAAALGAAVEILPLELIAPKLVEMFAPNARSDSSLS